jgi:hypothetical protein
MADLSGDRGGLIPAYNPANQLNPCLRRNVSRKSLVTSIAVIIPAGGLFRERRCNGCISWRIARWWVHDWRNN